MLFPLTPARPHFWAVAILVNEFDVATSDKLVRCLSRTACFIIEG